MLRSTATIPTDRAARYRAQLAQHGAGMMRHGNREDGTHTPPVQDVSGDDHAVVLDLIWGSCTITSTDTALVLLAQAESVEDLAKIQTGVEQRITKIGRRDGLVVAWSPVAGEAGSTGTAAQKNRHRGRLPVLAVAGLVVLMVAIHLGAAAFLLRHHWTWWILALIAAAAIGLKLVVARHFGFAMRMHRPAARGH